MSRATSRLQIPSGLHVIGPYVPAIAVVALQLVAFPVSAGAWSLGVIVGLLTALVAMGMALIYRSNRIINFAQGDLGLVPTVLAVGIIAVSGLPWLVGMIAGLAAALVLGAVVELVVIRRFFRAPRLLLTVATIGLSQLLIVCGLLIPRLWHLRLFTDKRIPDPVSWKLSIGTQLLGGSEILAVILAPLLLIGLGWFLRASDLGIAIRASAERSDRAAVLGIPVRRLQTLVWAIAAVLSFVGVFLHASIFGVGGAAALSPQVLVFALGALVLGRLDNLPAVTASAVALRILGQGIDVNNPSSPGRTYVILALVVLCVLVVQRSSRERKDVEGITSWGVSAEIRPVPRELSWLRSVRISRLLAPILVVAAAAALPLILGPGDLVRARTVVAFALIALSVVVLTGWAGQVSLGQMSFAGVGAVMGAVATQTWHLDLTLAILLAGLAGAAVAVVVGLPVIRLPGLYLSIATLAFALACSNFFLNRKEQAWIPRGALDERLLLRTIDLRGQTARYEFVLAVVVLCFIAVAGIRRSRTGRVLIAVRDNERAAAAYAVPVMRAKLTAFALSGFLAAVSGCLLVQANGAYDEEMFVAQESLGVFTSAVVGGLGSLTGAVLGAIYLSGGRFFLPNSWRLRPSAVGVLVVLMILPGGLSNLVFRGRDALLRRMARRRGIVVASLLADEAGIDAAVPDAIKVAMPGRPGSVVGATREPPEVPGAEPVGSIR